MPATLPPQTSLSNVPAYTTWPGGIDPTVSVYRLPATGGKLTKSRKAHRKTYRKASRKTQRKANRKASRKSQRR